MAVMLFSLASISQKCIRLRITLSQKGRQRFHIAFAHCSIPIIHRCKYTHCINRGSWDNLLLWIKHRVSWERAGFLPNTSSGTVPLALRSRQHSCDTFPLSPPFLPITHHFEWMNEWMNFVHQLTARTVQCYIGVLYNCGCSVGSSLCNFFYIFWNIQYYFIEVIFWVVLNNFTFTLKGLLNVWFWLFDESSKICNYFQGNVCLK